MFPVPGKPHFLIFKSPLPLDLLNKLHIPTEHIFNEFPPKGIVSLMGGIAFLLWIDMRNMACLGLVLYNILVLVHAWT